jgi:hypothetical protein
MRTQKASKLTAAVAVAAVSLALQSGCSAPAGRSASEAPPATASQPPAAASRGAATSPAVSASPGTAPQRAGRYPRHTGIVATTFWVGEIFDPDSPDGSQEISTYDGQWMQHYGGCDGTVVRGTCQTQRRSAANGYFPTSMVPRENPFYLDLPFDDVNDARAFARRAAVIPWAGDPGYAGHARDPDFSYLKNRWVKLMRDGRTCYGQIEDAGPGQYDDYRYVFGPGDARPASKQYNGAGLDVSPALTGCLAFSELNGDEDRVDWEFVDAAEVPPGPWTTLVTSRGVSE